MGGWMDGWIDRWMGGWMDGWMDRWMGGWMGGWMGRWMDGWMDGQTEEGEVWADGGDPLKGFENENDDTHICQSPACKRLPLSRQQATVLHTQGRGKVSPAELGVSDAT